MAAPFALTRRSDPPPSDSPPTTQCPCVMRTLHAVVLAALVVTAVVGTALGAARPPSLRELRDAGVPIYCAGGNRGEVAFTFDDGPGPYTAELVALLKQY